MIYSDDRNVFIAVTVLPRLPRLPDFSMRIRLFRRATSLEFFFGSKISGTVFPHPFEYKTGPNSKSIF